MPSSFSSILILSGFFLLSNNWCASFLIQQSPREKIAYTPTVFPDILLSTRRTKSIALHASNSSVYETFRDEIRNNLKDDDGRSDQIVQRITDYFTIVPSTYEEDVTGEAGKRGNIQLVAGSGKTFIAWRVMENVLRHKVAEVEGKGTKKPRIGVYVTPYLNLVDQALNNRDDHEIMSKESNNIDVDTMIIASRSSRKQEKLSTHVEDILEFLGDEQLHNVENTECDGRSSQVKVFVCTYNSLPRLGDALRRQYSETKGMRDAIDNNGIVDFAVFDEAHKMEGVGSGKRSSGFAYGLYDSNIAIQNRLFMSGTPNNYTQATTVIEGLPMRPRQDGARIFVPKRGDTSDEDRNTRRKRVIRSFRDEALFGPCLALKSHQQSVEENVTLPISLYCVDTDVFQEYNSNSNVPEGAEKDYYLPLAIQSAFQKLNVKHAISFHSTNERARDFVELSGKVLENSNENETIALFNMDHTMTPSERREILDEAEMAPRSLITNCKLLSMGVDEASLDLVVIADPVLSSINGRQMIGRVGRKAPGKERGYVLVPVPVEDASSFDRGSHAYRMFVNTFNHMVSLDPELRRDVMFLIEKEMELGRSLEMTELSERIREAFIFPETMPIKLKQQLMDSAIVEYTNGSYSSRWNSMFGFLVQYKEREGHCNVPFTHVEDGMKLGLWLTTQRQNKMKGNLDQDQEERMTELGVVWDLSSQRWNSMFGFLVQYKEREGHCNVPQTHVEDGMNLGRWLNTQRQNKKKGTLDQDREERMTELGVIWMLRN